MPISFFHTFEGQSFSINSEDTQHKNLLTFISKKEKEFPSDLKKEHNISLLLETKFVRSKSSDNLNIRIDSNSKITVNVEEEENFKNKYPWSWKEGLKPQLDLRYTNLKYSKAFWELKKTLEENDDFSKARPLDWNKPTGTKKIFYSPNILKEFDKHYTKK